MMLGMKNRKSPSIEEIALELAKIAIVEIEAQSGIDSEFIEPQVQFPVCSPTCIIFYETPSAQERKYHETTPSLDQLALGEALKAKSAEYWLSLGDASQALMEWEKLSSDSRKHPMVVKLHLRILRALGNPECLQA